MCWIWNVYRWLKWHILKCIFLNWLHGITCYKFIVATEMSHLFISPAKIDWAPTASGKHSPQGRWVPSWLPYHEEALCLESSGRAPARSRKGVASGWVLRYELGSPRREDGWGTGNEPLQCRTLVKQTRCHAAHSPGGQGHGHRQFHYHEMNILTAEVQSMRWNLKYDRDKSYADRSSNDQLCRPWEACNGPGQTRYKHIQWWFSGEKSVTI